MAHFEEPAVIKSAPFDHNRSAYLQHHAINIPSGVQWELYSIG